MNSFLLAHKRALLAKTEISLGVDAEPTPEQNAILVSELAITPLLAEEALRAKSLAHFANNESILAGLHAEVTFAIECAASGETALEPAWAKLMRACGCRQTSLTQGAGTLFNPTSQQGETLSIHIYMDKTRHVLTACRGTFSIHFEAQEFPRFVFQFRGKYTNPQSQAFPKTQTQNFIQPELPSAQTITVFRLGNIDLGVERFRFELNNNFPYSARLNEEQIDIVGREPSGQMTIRDPGLESENIFQIVENARMQSLQIKLGKTPGHQIEFTFPQVQVKPPRYDASYGIQNLELPLVFLPLNGDDEFSITVS